MNGTEPESADCHSVADKSEHLGRYEFGVCKVADRDVFCPEVEILGTAEEGIPILGAVLRLEAVELDLVSLHEISALHLELVLGGQ